MSAVDDRLAILADKVKAKRNADAAKTAKARDDIARANTLAELKSALLRYLA